MKDRPVPVIPPPTSDWDLRNLHKIRPADDAWRPAHEKLTHRIGFVEACQRALAAAPEAERAKLDASISRHGVRLVRAGTTVKVMTGRLVIYQTEDPDLTWR